ncbi:MAG TPA: hypothetical protein VGB54_11620 [Allosphingosinicella sp.]
MRIIIAAALSAAALCAAVAGCTDGERSGFREGNAWALASANPLGPPIHCISLARIRGHMARDDRTIDFQLDDGSVLRNRLPNACPGLMRSKRFTHRTGLDRLCSVDLITLIEATGAAGPSCGLGLFQPVAIPAQQGAAPGAG